jgi:glycosyltransferase involved in cell wall biosynthesis
LKDEIDIIHVWPSGALQTLKVAKELGIKTVLERPNTHTRYAFEIVGEECRKLGVKLPKSHSHEFDIHRLRLEEKEFELADRLLCPSPFVADTFLKYGFQKEKLAIHRYGYDPSAFIPLQTKSFEADNTPLRVAFLGSCEPRKGLHYALEAWLKSKASQKGKLLICGKFIRQYRKVLKKMISHQSIEETGYLSNPRGILLKCHALTLPSIEEGSALVTYEARACGCVLLVSDTSGAYCTHMHDALVHKVGDVAALTEHIDLLNSDMELRAKLQQNSMAGIGDLTWNRAGEILLDHYKKLLNISSV